MLTQSTSRGMAMKRILLGVAMVLAFNTASAIEVMMGASYQQDDLNGCTGSCTDIRKDESETSFFFMANQYLVEDAFGMLDVGLGLGIDPDDQFLAATFRLKATDSLSARLSVGRGRQDVHVHNIGGLGEQVMDADSADSSVGVFGLDYSLSKTVSVGLNYMLSKADHDLVWTPPSGNLNATTEVAHKQFAVTLNLEF